MFDSLTDRFQLYQHQPAGLEIRVLTSGFLDQPSAWIELIASWDTMAIIMRFQRLVLQDSVDVQAFSGAASCT